jgi:NADH dehydrogenase FAD-containing subunit
VDWFVLTAIGSALAWSQAPLASHRLIIIEQKSHFHYVYAFPRAAVKTGFEESLFVPYDGLFGGDDRLGQVVRAKATAIHKNRVELDREVPGFGHNIPFTHLIYAAGTTIPAPGHFEAYDKQAGIDCLKFYQGLIEQSQRPLVIGGGAVGLGKASYTLG